MTKLEDYKKITAGIGAREIIRWAVFTFAPGRLVLASSQSIEDQVLTEMLLSENRLARIFMLDTGRLFPETYETMEKTMERYGFRYEVLAPDGTGIETMVAEHGPNLFYKGLAMRKRCCEVRKTLPLKRVLATADAWITGLRRDQAITRSIVEPVEWDNANNIFKINPLYDWDENNVWEYVKKHDIPYNPLQDQGFRSIGCAPCTRAIGPDDDVRAGRWWWEDPEHKECGLHGRFLKNVKAADGKEQQ